MEETFLGWVTLFPPDEQKMRQKRGEKKSWQEQISCGRNNIEVKDTQKCSVHRGKAPQQPEPTAAELRVRVIWSTNTFTSFIKKSSLTCDLTSRRRQSPKNWELVPQEATRPTAGPTETPARDHLCWRCVSFMSYWSGKFKSLCHTLLMIHTNGSSRAFIFVCFKALLFSLSL